MYDDVTRSSLRGRRKTSEQVLSVYEESWGMSKRYGTEIRGSRRGVGSCAAQGKDQMRKLVRAGKVGRTCAVSWGDQCIDEPGKSESCDEGYLHS